MIGLYRPGDSPLHRLGAGVKLVALVALGAGVLWLRTPAHVGIALALVSALYLLAGFGPREWWAQVRAVWVVLVLVGLANWWLGGPERALVVPGQLLVLILAAALVTLTTRTTALIDAVVAAIGPLRRVGIDPERVGLTLALGIRSVPVVVSLAGEVREAQRARGLGTSARAFAVPLVLRSLHHADHLGEALAARGLDD